MDSPGGDPHPTSPHPGPGHAHAHHKLTKERKGHHTLRLRRTRACVHTCAVHESERIEASEEGKGKGMHN